MIKHIEVTGKNQEEAIAKALAQLGMDRDDVSVEILELGKTGFLGIGSVPAKVKVSYEAPDEPEPPVPAPVEEKPAEEKPAEKKPAPAPKSERTQSQPRRERTEKKPNAPAPRKETPAPKKDIPAPQKQAQAVMGEDETAAQITAFMTGLFQHMQVQAVPEITRDGDIYNVVLQGENLGSLIGRRGETLDAIQQLTGYTVNRGRAKRVRIHVDAEHYRARREESLQRLAHKVAGKVVRTRRSVTLEAMNAYERHVIHAALQDYPGVSTYSTGVEPNRRTVVAYDPGK